MTLSIFFAKFFGIYTLILGLILLFRRKEIQIIVSDIYASKGLLYVIGILGILIGLAVVITHHVWEFNWRGLITLLGYIAIIKGILRIAFQQATALFELKLLKGYWWFTALSLIIGFYLTYSGFSQ